MSYAVSEKLLAKVLAIGAAFTTIFIVSGSVTDPVNVPKMLSLGVVSMTAISISLSSGLRTKIRESRILFTTLLVFNLSMMWSTLHSDSPISQNIYGTYGRNNGLLTYFFLSLVLLSAALIRSRFEYLTNALIFAGLVNVVYCLWVVTFGDFIGWSNPYGNILGTLGNPNFIGSFLGIFLASYLAFVLKPKSSKYLRFSAILVIPVAGFEIVKSHAIQGRVVAALGMGIIGFLIVRSRFNSLVLAFYSVFVSILGILALLGALQIGPLTSLIYKTSVSLRGQYWLAGFNTGQGHLLTGVGMDSFGDWYRRSRDVHALVLPGPNTVVNASHNVPLDIFAFGGLPLLLSYLAVFTLTLIAIIRVIVRTKEFNSTFAILLTAWAGYQVQSIISINQIGLAIWGWLLGGAIIGFEKSTRPDAFDPSVQSKTVGNSAKSNIYSPRIVLAGSLGGLIGLLIALPAFTADAKWRSAQVARTLPAIEATMQSSYFNPLNTTKYLMNIQALEGSNLFELSHKYALDAVKWNPESFDLWRTLYLLRNSTEAEKESSLLQMKKLDPLNPDVTNTK